MNSEVSGDECPQYHGMQEEPHHQSIEQGNEFSNKTEENRTKPGLGLSSGTFCLRDREGEIKRETLTARNPTRYDFLTRRKNEFNYYVLRTYYLVQFLPPLVTMFQVDPGPGSPADLSHQTRQRDPAIGFWRHATVDRLGISYSARTRVDIERQPLMCLIRDSGRSIIDCMLVAIAFSVFTGRAGQIPVEGIV